MQTAPTSRNCATSDPDSASNALLAQALIAIENGISIEHYLAGRDAGATHAEILTAEREGLYRWGYASARKAGLTHRQVVRLNYRHWTPLVQAQVIGEGISPTELSDALDRNCSLPAYRTCRQRGLSHIQAVGRSLYVNC